MGVAVCLNASTSMLTTTETTQTDGLTAFSANGINQVCAVPGAIAELFTYEQDMSLFLSIFLIVFFFKCDPKYLFSCFLVDSKGLLFLSCTSTYLQPGVKDGNLFI